MSRQNEDITKFADYLFQTKHLKYSGKLKVNIKANPFKFPT